MRFDYGPKMGSHNLTYQCRQVNHYYPPNPGDLLTVVRGKIPPKIHKKVLSKSGDEKKSGIDIVFLQRLLSEIID